MTNVPQVLDNVLVDYINITMLNQIWQFLVILGNGYAINAIIGKDKYMQFGDQTFISSTFWTERIGPTAALKTLEEMEKLNLGK